MGVFEILNLALEAIEVGKKAYNAFRERAAQNGELTPEQEAALDARADALFSRWENAAPPPAPPAGVAP